MKHQRLKTLSIALTVGCMMGSSAYARTHKSHSHGENLGQQHSVQAARWSGGDYSWLPQAIHDIMCGADYQ